MKYSVVIPSYLGDYGGAAAFRDIKIVRAIDSVRAQTFEDWEIVLVADGCDKTVKIAGQLGVNCVRIEKAPIWDGAPRNAGIDNAKGEYIIYLDIDDWWGEEHLEIIDENIGDSDWVYFDDIIYRGEWMERHADIMRLGRCGTSNIVHRRSLNVRWSHRGYSHDYHFIQELVMASRNYKKIPTPQYYVMHIPGEYDL